MTNWTYKQKSDNDFMNSFSPETKKYLEFDDGFPSHNQARWFLDAHQLMKENYTHSYGDYSFMVVPASKALESWVFKVGNSLGVDIKTKNANKAREIIADGLDDILKEVDKKVSDILKDEFTQLRVFIQDYRNDIVHSNRIIDNPTRAENKIKAIIEKIDTLTTKLAQAGLISTEK